MVQVRIIHGGHSVVIQCLNEQWSVVIDIQFVVMLLRGYLVSVQEFSELAFLMICVFLGVVQQPTAEFRCHIIGTEDIPSKIPNHDNILRRVIGECESAAVTMLH